MWRWSYRRVECITNVLTRSCRKLILGRAILCQSRDLLRFRLSFPHFESIIRIDKLAKRDSDAATLSPSGQSASRTTDLQHERLSQHVPAPMKLTLIAFIAHCSRCTYGEQRGRFPTSLKHTCTFTITGPNVIPDYPFDLLPEPIIFLLRKSS